MNAIYYYQHTKFGFCAIFIDPPPRDFYSLSADWTFQGRVTIGNSIDTCGITINVHNDFGLDYEIRVNNKCQLYIREHFSEGEGGMSGALYPEMVNEFLSNQKRVSQFFFSRAKKDEPHLFKRFVGRPMSCFQSRVT